jgi:hypothetical protein
MQIPCGHWDELKIFCVSRSLKREDGIPGISTSSQKENERFFNSFVSFRAMER